MSIWSTLFLECWKRYHAELAYKWNVFGMEVAEEVQSIFIMAFLGSLRSGWKYAPGISVQSCQI